MTNIPTDRPTFHHGPEGEGFTCWRDDDGSSWWWRGDSFKDAFQLSGGFSAVRILLDELHPAPIVLEADGKRFARNSEGDWLVEGAAEDHATLHFEVDLLLDRLAIAEGLMKPPVAAPQETEQ